uniref:RNA-dependent RNA polymerase n=1 Tax=Macrostomum lignano TaxID=282301 RepID=A0A1I8FF01_9PLAT
LRGSRLGGLLYGAVWWKISCVPTADYLPGSRQAIKSDLSFYGGTSSWSSTLTRLVLPPEGSLCGGQDVWIYFKDPLLTLIGSNFSCERLRGQLVVKDLRQRGGQLPGIVLTRQLAATADAGFYLRMSGRSPSAKRPAAADQNLNSAGDPAVVDALRSIGLEEDFMAFLSNP